MSSRSNQHQSFDEDCVEAVGSLRAALLGLYRAVDADPARPQEVSRRFKLDKSLTWKVSRAVQSNDAFAAAAVLPGSSGIGILLEAMRKGRAPAPAIEQVRRASSALEQVIEIHAGDRESLRAMLDSAGRNGKALELSRKQAFRGNTGIWGLRCNVRVAASFVAPSAGDPDRLDLGLIAGWTNVRRLRPVPRWPLLQVSHMTDAETALSDHRGDEPWMPDEVHNGFILRAFCSGAMPPIHATALPGGTRLELGDGPIGRTGEFTCFAGHLNRAIVSRHASEGDRFAQFRTGVVFPAASMHFDLFVHTSLKEAMAPEVEHFCFLPGEMSASEPSHRLPITAPMHALGRHPRVATPHVARYDELIESVMGHAGWDLADFHCFRVVYPYPPVQSTVMMKYELPDR